MTGLASASCQAAKLRCPADLTVSGAARLVAVGAEFLAVRPGRSSASAQSIF